MFKKPNRRPGIPIIAAILVGSLATFTAGSWTSHQPLAGPGDGLGQPGMASPSVSPSVSPSESPSVNPSPSESVSPSPSASPSAFPGTASPQPSASPAQVTINIPQNSTGMGDQAYGTNPLIIPVGTQVTWINDDSAPHTATSDTGVFDSGTLNQGQSFSFTFETAGTFPYFCTIHGKQSMSGTIQVN